MIVYIIPITETKNDLGVIDFKELGPIGDLWGGLTNPVLGLLGIIAASLAFYAQYQANRQVQEQFSIQQFESQFYEMLQLHRANLDENIIEGYEFDYPNGDKSIEGDPESRRAKETKGKKVYVTFLIELHVIKRIFDKKIYEAVRCDSQLLSKFWSADGQKAIFNIVYYVFFLGIVNFKRNIPRLEKNDKSGLLKGNLMAIFKELKEIRNLHEKGVKKHPRYLQQTNEDGTRITKTLWLSFNYRPFSGHQSKLAHYYRLLFQIVKFVDKQDSALLTYEKKRDYLRIVRAVLSNHEQVLLFYNWHSNFGLKWEEKDVKQRQRRKGNYFLTDYRMIHNLPPELLMDGISIQEVFNKNYHNFKYESGRRNEDELFELGDPIISSL